MLLSSFDQYMLAHMVANLFHVSLQTAWVIQWVASIVLAFALAFVIVMVQMLWRK